MNVRRGLHGSFSGFGAKSQTRIEIIGADFLKIHETQNLQKKSALENCVSVFLMKQLKLFNEKLELEFGGTLNSGVRKRARPLFTKSPSHFVLKAEQSDILLKNQEVVKETVLRLAAQFGIVMYDLAIQVDHAHIINQIPTRDAYNKWVRSVTGTLSRKLKIKWRLRPYNRRVTWGREFRSVTEYVDFNRKEAQFILDAHERVEQWKSIVLEGC